MAASSCRINGEGAASIAFAGAGAAVVMGAAARSGVATSLTFGRAAMGRGGGPVSSADGVLAAATDDVLDESTELTADVEGGAARGTGLAATGAGAALAGGFVAAEVGGGDAEAGDVAADALTCDGAIDGVVDVDVTVGSALAMVLLSITRGFTTACSG